jgi:hypothetical protein
LTLDAKGSKSSGRDRVETASEVGPIISRRVVVTAKAEREGDPGKQ